MNESPLPLVLIPGFMLDESLWDEFIEHVPHHRESHCANLLHGQSIAEMAQAVAAHAPSKFILIGFSLGGYVARSLLAQFPERVAALILIATSLRSDSPQQRQLKHAALQAAAQGEFRGLSAASISKSLHEDRAKDKQLLQRVRAMGRRMGYEVFARQSLLERGGIPTSIIHCPTLIIAAAQDALRSSEETRELCEAIPWASVEVVQGSGHMIPLEQPELLARLVSDWLAHIERQDQ